MEKKHTFQNPELEKQALAYGSQEFEELEFLGDRVLNLAVAEIIFDHFRAEANIGHLHLRMASCINRRAMAATARSLRMHINPDGSIENTTKVLADRLEAYTAAIYLDAGLSAAKEYIAQTLNPSTNSTTERPPKSVLQEYTVARRLSEPKYTRERIAEASYKTTCQVGEYCTTATERNRRMSDDRAAVKMLHLLQQQKEDHP